MDKHRQAAPMIMKALHFDGFDHSASWAAKVRNVSRLGSLNKSVGERPDLVRLCYYDVVRTTLDISDEAYYIAKAIARDQNRSLGRVIGDLILKSSKGGERRTHNDE